MPRLGVAFWVMLDAPDPLDRSCPQGQEAKARFSGCMLATGVCSSRKDKKELASSCGGFSRSMRLTSRRFQILGMFLRTHESQGQSCFGALSTIARVKSVSFLA